MVDLHEEPLSPCIELINMNNVQDQENPQAIKPNIISHDSQNGVPNDATSTNDNKRVSREDIELVQRLIERCLQKYMKRDEVVKTILNSDRIDPAFTTLVWEKLEEENGDFFRAYYIRLKLTKQIMLFNNLLAHQYQLMNGIQPMPAVNNLSLGNGVPAPGNYNPMQMNSGKDMVMDTNTGDNGMEHSIDSIKSLPQIPLNFSFSNLGDLGALGKYPGSPFLPSDSDVQLDTPEQEDIVEEFFVDSDSVPGQRQSSDEEKKLNLG